MNSLPERWRQNVKYWQTLFHVYVRAKAKPNVLEDVGREVLARIPPDQDSGGNERIRIAETWLKYGVDPRAAENVAREAVDIAEVGDRPPATPTSTHSNLCLGKLINDHLRFRLYPLGCSSIATDDSA